MKIIGMAGGDYIAVVTHTELEKLTDKFYGKMERLQVGSEMDLGAGYDFRSSIKGACDGMVKQVDNFKSAQSKLIQFALMVSALPDGNNEGDAA